VAESRDECEDVALLLVIVTELEFELEFGAFEDKLLSGAKELPPVKIVD
jgi:hypothetical protein